MASDIVFVDKNSFFIKTIDFNLINEIYYPVISELNSFLKNKISSYSLYFTGSVASGTSINFISDLDIIFFCYSNDLIERFFFVEIEKKILLEYNFITKIDFNIVNKFDIKNITVLEKFYLKYLSVYISGIKIHELVEPIKILSLPFENLPKLRERILHIRNKILLSDDIKLRSIYSKSIMRSIVRSGFELCMRKELFYTKNIDLCFKIFSNHFPYKVEQMKMVYLGCYDIILDEKEILFIFDNFAIWMLDEYEKIN